MSKTTTEVAVKQQTSVALTAGNLNIEEDAGSGFENADKDSYAIPFLRILQSGSPQCKKSEAEYIKGAEEGDFYNTVTKKVYKGENGVNLIPAHYDRKFTEWAPARGGFKGEHLPSDPVLTHAVKKVSDDGREALTLPNGNVLTDTRYHFCLHIEDDGSFAPVLICMSSSGIRKSKRMMTELNGKKIKNAEGRSFTPPMFLNKLHLKSVPESNDQGSWFNYEPVLNGLLDITNDNDAELYQVAREFRNSITSGKVEVKHEGEDVTATTDRF